MDVRLLGPVEASVDGRPVPLGAGKPRAVLALLALHAGSTISSDRLIDGLWGERPPATATKLVHVYVSQLRKALAAGGNGAQIVTRGHGYQLRLGPDDVDVRRFERLVARGMPREALALWRGPALDDVAGEPFAAAEIRRLEELRLAAVELAIQRDLEAGRHREVVGELEALVLDEPLREELHAQRMLALYRSGRQADALAAYRQARAALVEAIGVEPGPELRRLHEAILRQDPSLEAPASEPVRPAPELDTGTPLVGREADLDRLREHWRKARDGAGRLVLVTGAEGMGKTRLAAEVAAAVRRDGGAVLFASGADALDGVSRARAARQPTLLVLDDVDQAGEPLGAALGELGEGLGALPLLVVATAEDGASTAVHAAATLSLRPLDDDGVRAVARSYAGARADVELPVARLMAASGGLPRRLHSAASAWARSLAARRVGDAAKRIAADRPGLRAVEDDLAGSIVELQAAGERAAPGRTEGLVVCPYKGLASFEVEDSAFFFGRERLVADMVARLTGAPLTGIVGSSGSGKSSVLQAGLLAALTAGVLPGSEDWALALLRPGAQPARALEHAAADAAPSGRLVIAVDQFEEVFTACRDERERAAFVDMLARRARDPYRRTLVLVAIRADFYGRCAAYPELARLLGANHVLVGPMRRDELRRAIEAPARCAGLHVEPDLADALVADVEGEPGALPLLSTSLLELWQHRDGRTLRLADYEHADGVHGAVARLAERAYERLDPEQRQVARRILLRLAGDGEGDAIVRRRVALAEIAGTEPGGGVADVLAVLADDRLVTTGDGGIEVAHEALLREWPRLRGWLEDDAEGRRLHRHLTHAASDWLAAGRDSDELYRGARLAAALDWNAEHEQEVNELEREFLGHSRAEAEREGELQRQANRRLRALLVGLALLLTLAVVAGVVAVSQRGQAREAAVAADAQRVGAEALTRERLDQSLLLARAGVELDDSAPTRGNLLSALMRNPQALGMLPGDGAELWASAVSPDGRLVAIGGRAGIVTFVDAASRRPVGKPYRLRNGYVQDMRFSPDGATLAVGGMAPPNPENSGVVDLVDTRTHTRRLRIVPPPFRGAKYIYPGVLFALNGRDVIVQQIHEAPNLEGPPSVLRRFDGVTGAAEGPPLRVGRHQSIGMSSTGDRRRLFVTSQEDGETSMIDAERLRVMARWPVGDFAGTVNLDGSAFALGSQEGEVRLLDLRSGRVRSFTGRHEGSVHTMKFTPDGRTLVTSGSDGNLIVWDVAGGAIRETLSGHAAGQLWGLDVSPDGRTAYSAGEEGRAFVWDLQGDRRLVRPFAGIRPFEPDDDTLPRGLVVSPDSRTLALGHSDGTVDLIDTETLRRRRSFQALRGFVGALAFSPHGRLLAVAGQHGHATLWDAHTLRPAGKLEGMTTTIQTLTFSPDGELLAVAELGTTTNGDDASSYKGGQIRVWDVRRHALTATRVRLSSPSIAFSPGGRLLAVAAISRPTEIRDARSGRLVARLRTAGWGRSVAFSPDGGLLATGHYEGTGQLWSTESWKPVGRPLEGHDGKRFLWMDFAHDGATLATAGQDGTLALWDVNSQIPVGPPLSVEADAYVAATLSPDGSHLFAESGNGHGVRWNISPDAWEQHACRVAGRELTPREWADALPDRPYRTVCGTG
jgi:WD40 repeat protein/DNA-binding SARP family transcriptional activator